jgi:hypothetical protein
VPTCQRTQGLARAEQSQACFAARNGCPLLQNKWSRETAAPRRRTQPRCCSPAPDSAANPHTHTDKQPDTPADRHPVGIIYHRQVCWLLHAHNQTNTGQRSPLRQPSQPVSQPAGWQEHTQTNARCPEQQAEKNCCPETMHCHSPIRAAARLFLRAPQTTQPPPQTANTPAERYPVREHPPDTGVQVRHRCAWCLLLT